MLTNYNLGIFDYRHLKTGSMTLDELIELNKTTDIWNRSFNRKRDIAKLCVVLAREGLLSIDVLNILLKYQVKPLSEIFFSRLRSIYG